MDYKHIKMANGKAELFLYNEIGGHGSTASDIASEIQWLASFGESSEILVHINSVGGSMIEGFGIFSALQNAKKEHAMIVNVQIDGLAASMASFIAMVGDSITIVDFGQIMIHDPSFGGGTPTPKEQAILDKFKDSALTIYQAKTGKTNEEISAMMTEETWMNAEEAVALGFANSILATDLNQVAAEFADILNGTDFQKREAILVSDQYDPVMHAFTKPKQQPINAIHNMKKIAMVVGLDSSASEEQIEAKVKKISNELDTVKADNTKKDKSIQDLTAKVETAEAEKRKAEATHMIEAAITGGKIKEDKKAAWIERAETNPEMVEAMLSEIEAVATPAGSPNGDTLLEAVKLAAKGTAESGAAPTVSLREMEQKDPEKLEKIRNEQPEVYASMFKTQYGKEYTV